MCCQDPWTPRCRTRLRLPQTSPRVEFARYGYHSGRSTALKITTFTIALLLIVLGLGCFGYALSSDVIQMPAALTTLVPTVVGLLLGVCGLLALKESRRKHAMHAAAMIGLLGFVAAAGRLGPNIPKLLQGDFPSEAGKQLATTGLIGMGTLCLIFVILCVRSFIQARMARSAEQTG